MPVRQSQGARLDPGWDEGEEGIDRHITAIGNSKKKTSSSKAGATMHPCQGQRSRNVHRHRQSPLASGVARHLPAVLESSSDTGTAMSRGSGGVRSRCCGQHPFPANLGITGAIKLNNYPLDAEPCLPGCITSAAAMGFRRTCCTNRQDSRVAPRCWSGGMRVSTASTCRRTNWRADRAIEAPLVRAQRRGPPRRIADRCRYGLTRRRQAGQPSSPWGRPATFTE